jgi:hypothetical protein
MGAKASRAMLMVAAAITLTPAFLMMAISGHIREPESSPVVAILTMYLVMALYFLPATAVAGGGGAVLLEWFARKPGILRGAALTSAFATLLAFTVAVVVSVASLGYVPLVQNAYPYIRWAAMAGVIEASALAWFVKHHLTKR